MPTTWILIADRGGARLFTHRGRSTGLELIEAIPHPEGRLKNGDINADKHGRAFDSKGVGRHAMSTSQEPTAQMSMRFAKQLSERLEQGAMRNAFDRLVVAAAPRFLGDLRGTMGDNASARLTTTLNKDLSGADERELRGHLADILPL
jgi:protein required for attachment to host cells